MDLDDSCPLASTAYVVVDQANCLYEPTSNSAIRIIPPYGSEVEVVQDDGRWVLIRFCGKEAWSPREHLSPVLINRKEAIAVGRIVTEYARLRQSMVEYGPRGGRFMRSPSGFRRYF